MSQTTAKNAKKAQQAAENQAKRVKKPKVTAGPCPKNDGHKNTRVYKTHGRTRYCKCDDCGTTWKIVADFADDLHEYVRQLADDLDSAGRIDGDDGPVIVLADKTAKDIAKELRDLVNTAE